MRSLRTIFSWGLVSVLTSTVLPTLAHEEQVIVVGRSAGGELRIHSDFDQPVELPVSIFPGMPGYATGELALHSTILDDPTNDFFQLSVAADFRLILLAKDPGMEVWGGTSYLGTNDSLFVGASPFDVHPIWNLVNGTPGDAYSLTLKLRDLNGIYPDSSPFVLSFTPTEVRHQITITQSGPFQATLGWPTNAAGWLLQSAASIASVSWDTITNAPAIAGTNFFLGVTTTDTQRFFRLKKP